MRLSTITALLLTCVLLAGNSAAQSPDQQASEFLRQSDSLYTVVTVLVTIFAGLIVFLVFQERKISKLEKQIKRKTHE